MQEAAIGTSLAIFCQFFGGAVFTSVGETIFVNSLAALLPAFVPQVNVQALINAGAAGVRTAVTEAELPSLLFAYNQALLNVFVRILSQIRRANGIISTFTDIFSKYLATATAVASFFTCWGMGWKRINEAETK